MHMVIFAFFRSPCYSLTAAGNKNATWRPLPLLGCGGE